MRILLANHLLKTEKILKFKETGGFKNSYRRAASNKVLRDKAFIIARNLKYDGGASFIGL